MQELEIRELNSQLTHRVPEAGAVLGRESQRADIVVKNPSVSKRHARIFWDRSAWYIEDLGSSNGTFVQNQRIAAPQRISPRTAFTIAEVQFEVVRVVGSAGEELLVTQGEDEHPSFSEKSRDPGPRPEAQASPKARSMLADEDKPPLLSTEDHDGQSIPKAVISSIFRAIPWYVKSAISLVFTAPKTIKRSTDELPIEALRSWQLVGWALAASLISIAFGQTQAIVAMVRARTFILSAVLPVVPVVSAIIGAIVVGFLLHPVMKWIVAFLGGSSDERTRTNAFVLLSTASLLLVVPGVVSTILGFVPLALLQLAPLVVVVFLALIMAWATYAWFRRFAVKRWAQIGFAVLAFLGPVSGAVSQARAIVASFRAGAEIPATVASKDAPLTPDEETALATVTDMAKRAVERTKQPQRDDTKTATASTKTPIPARVAHEDDAAQKKVEAVADPKPSAAPVAMPERTVQERPKDERTSSVRAGASATPPARTEHTGPSLNDYRLYAARRAAVEKVVADDPTVLERATVLDAYDRYQKAKYEAARTFVAKKQKNDPWRDRINERLKEAAVFRATSRTIDELYRALEADMREQPLR